MLREKRPQGVMGTLHIGYHPAVAAYVSVAPRTSFGDRISTCLDDAAAGLDQAGRATYSRSCANC